jgi:hypothetical protein
LAALAAALLLPAVAAAEAVDTTLWVANGAVYALAKYGTTLYAGGDFTAVAPCTGGGTPLSTATGALAKPFPRVEGTVLVGIPDGAGGWFIGGRFSAVGGAPRANLARIRANGSVAGWNPGANRPVYTLAVNGASVLVSGRRRRRG